MLTRKQFLLAALETTGAALGLTILSACGGSSSPSGADAAAASCVQNGTTTAIAANHGHVLVVSKQDVAAGADKSYDIRGTADHTHTVALSEEHFHDLAENHAIMTTSSTELSHSHGVMVACV